MKLYFFRIGQSFAMGDQNSINIMSRHANQKFDF